jgi:dihydrofolate synthase/folylpolyglutamate synthase
VTDAEYRRTLDRLFALRRFGLRPGLEVTRALLGELGDPHRGYPTIHVTGSKGKGSVTAIAASILGAAGRTVGRYTSPHLRSYRERIRVGDREISRSEVVEGVERVEAAALRLERTGRIDRPPTFFELTTVLAFDRFRRAKVDAAVVEVGIGGRLDATNVLDAAATAVVTVELEHTEILGATIPEVAREKAGILHPGTRTVVGELPDAAREVVDRTADHLGVPVWHLGEEVRVEERDLHPGGQTLTVALPHRSFRNLELPLLGRFQSGNAAVAVALASVFAQSAGFELSESAVRSGVSRVTWRGRLELLKRKPDLYVDVAHTPESAAAVALSLGEIQPFEDASENVLLFGCLADKAADRILDRLSPVAQTVVLVPLRTDRAATPEVLRVAAQGRFPRIVQAPSVAAGLKLARVATAPGGFTLALGSDYLVGEVLEALEGTVEGGPDLSDSVRLVASSPHPTPGPSTQRATRDGTPVAPRRRRSPTRKR